MLLSHVWGLYTRPKREWALIRDDQQSLVLSLQYIAFLALIPTLCAYLASSVVGFSVTTAAPVKLTHQSALVMAGGMYIALNVGVILLAALAFWMAQTFGAKPSFKQTVELASYTATPLFMAGLAGLYPSLWLLGLAGLIGIGWSVYLLYTGLPIVMKIEDDRGFIYASAVVTCGLVLMVGILISSVLLWGMGLGPVYTH